MYKKDESLMHVHFSKSNFTLRACLHQVNTVIPCFDLIHYYSDIICDVKHGERIMLIQQVVIWQKLEHFPEVSC